jgi:tetratricopeptide (TPR) repeat protein
VIGTSGNTEAVPFTTFDAGGRASVVTRSTPIDKGHQANVAREAYEKALAIEPGLDEARLRLGRVLWGLGRIGEAQESLERITGATGEPVRYLAHLFHGRCLEDTADLEGAVREYQAALGVIPDSQVGAVALAHALSLRGDADGARAVLERILPLSGTRKALDPYWIYLNGAPAVAESLYDALRLESAR